MINKSIIKCEVMLSKQVKLANTFFYTAFFLNTIGEPSFMKIHKLSTAPPLLADGPFRGVLSTYV